jgi:hypothetical protein
MAIGDNNIEIRASDPSGGSGIDSITLTRLPSLVTGLAAAADKGQVTLSWNPVAGATSYNLYWVTSRNVPPANGTKISGLSSPFTHTGLSDDTPHYYTVTAVIAGVEGSASAIAWATPGWRTETVAATSPTTFTRTISIAADSVGNAHIHYSFDVNTPTTITNGNYYATNASGPWAPLQIDQPLWVSSSIAVDTGGLVHVAYLDFTSLKHAIYIAGSWVSEAVDAQGMCDVSLALDAADKAHIAHSMEAVGGKSVRYVTNASGSWIPNDIETFNHGGCYPPRKVSVGVDANGAAHVAYAGDSPNYGLKYATNLGGTWTVSTLDTGVINQVSVGVDTNGKAHIAYANNHGQLKYAQNASGAWVVETLAGRNHPSLAIDAAGKVHLSYIGTGAELHYATNSAGNWRVVPIDVSQLDFLDSGATDTAIALDPEGKVHIGYVRGGNIRYATNK